MKKQNSIWIAFLAVAALLVVTTGVVFAGSLMHDSPPVNPDREDYRDYHNDDEHWGSMHGRGYGRRQFEGGISSMMSEMVDAVSAQTGLTVEQIEDRLVEGEHLFNIALDAGLDEETFFDLMAEVRDTYFADVEEDGLIDRMGLPADGIDEGFPCHQQADDYSPMFNGSQRGFGRRW